MYLENIVIDAVDPQRVGRFWQAAVGGEQLTDEPGIFETRLSIDDGPVLDLCVQQVPEPPADPLRLHFDLLGGARQAETVDRLLRLGARHLDLGQGDVGWVVLADPEGNPFCVMEDRDAYVRTGPIAALPLDAADVDIDAAFWSWLTGWIDRGGIDRGDDGPRILRHPSGRGPLLALCPEPEAKVSGVKNRIHLDVRLQAGDDPDQVAAGIVERGGHELQHPDWGEQPWRFYTDPSGNDLCVLPACF